ncbi:unnamed protein product, partial [Larinioides sclopetarius]
MKGSPQNMTEELKSPDQNSLSNIGSFGIIPFEKFSPEHAFPVVTGSPPEVNKGKFVLRGYSAWFVLKSAIFLACVMVCFYQSVDFYKHYFTYPLTTGFTVINPKFYKIPAITFCVRSPFKLTKFCKKNPHFCQRPIDLEDFCLLYPFYCKDDISNLKIPKMGYFADLPSAELEYYIFQSFRNYKMNLETPLIFKPKLWNNSKYTVVENPFEQELKKSKFMRCLSYNLHLMSDKEPEIKEAETDEEGTLPIETFLIFAQMKDIFFPWAKDQVFFSVHSPYVPVNPLTEGDSLEPGFKYKVFVRLEEEHLQPSPYPTNCTDYLDLWKKNNRTGPRSQEMCKSLCYLSYTRKCFGCEKAKLILYDPKNLCPAHLKESDCPIDFNTEVQPCKRRCQPNCLKLKYHTRVVKIETHEKIFAKRDYITVDVSVRDTDVTVLTHNPLYGLVESPSEAITDLTLRGMLSTSVWMKDSGIFFHSRGLK